MAQVAGTGLARHWGGDRGAAAAAARVRAQAATDEKETQEDEKANGQAKLSDAASKTSSLHLVVVVNNDQAAISAAKSGRNHSWARIWMNNNQT